MAVQDDMKLEIMGTMTLLVVVLCFDEDVQPLSSGGSAV